MSTSRSPACIASLSALLLCACLGTAKAFAADAKGPASAASASDAASASNATAGGDVSTEREALAALTRELDLLARLAEHAAAAAPQEHTRYHFDYDRLREDMQRVRAGVQDYLVPQRAQPRDPLAISGDYARSRPADSKETP